MRYFSRFGFGEVADLDELKGGESRPSGLMTLSKSKNADAFFSSFGLMTSAGASFNYLTSQIRADG